MSALSSALAVLLTYLTTLRLIRIAQRRGVAEPAAAAPAPVPDLLAQPAGLLGALRAEWLFQLGAVTAAFMLAFSSNFWDNATGAETYSEMAMAQVLILWLALRWWEAHEQRPTVGPLLVAVYVMWLSVGLMLGVGMMGLPLLVLLLLVDRRVFVLFAMPMASVLGVTYGLEKMAGIVLIAVDPGVLVLRRRSASSRPGWRWRRRAGRSTGPTTPSARPRSRRWPRWSRRRRWWCRWWRWRGSTARAASWRWRCS